MKSEITITIDPTDPEQVAAALVLFQKLSGATVITPAAVEVKTPETPKPEKAKTEKKAKVEEVAAPPVVETEEPETTPEPEPAKSTTTIKIEEVRAELSKKVANHREAIKAKLNSFGALNVSTMDASKYPEFIDFLTALK